MKRDPELIRSILLEVEACPNAEVMKLPPIIGSDEVAVSYHIRILVEAGLLRCLETTEGPRRKWIAIRLTWRGHDYLDQVRDPEIWRVAKIGAGRLGSWSLETLGALAKSAILAKANSLGLTLAT